jgi:hypothetical protein
MALTRAGYSNIFSRLKPRTFDSMQVAAGAPTAPTLTLQFDRTLLTWTATSGLAGAASSYVVESVPSGPTITVSGTSATVTGMTISTVYQFTVFGVNSAGGGPRSNQVTYTHAYNDGSGGNITTFAKGGGQWRSHRFFSTATLTMTRATLDSETLVVSGGNGGGYSHPADPRGPGAAGPAKKSTQHIPLGARTATRGGGGGGGQAVHEGGFGGGASEISGIINSGGGGYVESDNLDGVNRGFPGNGYGGGGAACYLCPAQGGQPGLALSAYRIA